MALEHTRDGDQLWKRFNRGRASIEWYYRAIAASLSGTALAGHPLVRELRDTVAAFFGPDTGAGRAGPPAPA